MNDLFCLNLIKEICKEKNIKLTELSLGYILQLEKGNTVKHFFSYKFDLNSEASGSIACDKYATYEVLKANNIPVVEHKILFNPISRKDYVSASNLSNQMEDYFYKNVKSIVVKPNNGTGGKGVFLCKSFENLKFATDFLFQKNSSISMCPYYNTIAEYRVIYLDGECLLVFKKSKPFVIGNNHSTIRDLLLEKEIPLNIILDDNFGVFDFNRIPKKDEIVEVSWKYNLSHGATACVLNDKNLESKIKDLAIKAGQSMNIRFASIDIFETTEHELSILEINSSVCLGDFFIKFGFGYSTAKQIFSKAIDIAFENE